MSLSTDLEWFTHDRFGIFIHWGLYSLGARHEWMMNHERTPRAEYEKYAKYFAADRYDPAEWARQAVAAGARYVVLTTKHHEGFCLWDSALTDYTAVNTPAGRDLLRPFVDAARDAGLKVGLYHSVIDWHHPDFTIDGISPRRDDADVAEQNAGRDMSRYREYLHGQVRELLSDYGRIDYMFYDFSYHPETGFGIWGGKGADDWGAEALLELTRGLQPGIIVNDRLGLPGDFATPEEYAPSEPLTNDGRPVVWEACHTLNGSWGYERDNHDYKTVRTLVQLLVDGVSKGGNLLLNVGPTGRGEFDPRARDALAGVGSWMDLHSRSIRGAGPSRHVPPTDVRYTQVDDRLYVHVLAWPLGHLHLPGLAGKVDYAQLLNDGSEIRMRVIEPTTQAQNTNLGGQPAGTLTLMLPATRPDVVIPVIELFLREE